MNPELEMLHCDSTPQKKVGLREGVTRVSHDNTVADDIIEHFIITIPVRCNLAYTSLASHQQHLCHRKEREIVAVRSRILQPCQGLI